MGKKQTPVTKPIPSGMSENSSKSKPPMNEEIKESKEKIKQRCTPKLPIHLEILNFPKLKSVWNE